MSAIPNFSEGQIEALARLLGYASPQRIPVAAADLFQHHFTDPADA